MPLFVPGLPKSNNEAAAPDANDDNTAGYAIGSQWIDSSTTPDTIYSCTDASTGAAVWQAVNLSGHTTLIERIDVTANTTTVTFSGLNGDVDKLYKCIYTYIANGGGSHEVQVRPNGITANQSTRQIDLGSSYITAVTNRFNMANGGDGVNMSGIFHLWAHKLGPGATPIKRDFLANWTIATQAFITTGQWNDTSTNITSLEITDSVASGIGIGSNFALYKIADTF